MIKAFTKNYITEINKRWNGTNKKELLKKLSSVLNIKVNSSHEASNKLLIKQFFTKAF